MLVIFRWLWLRWNRQPLLANCWGKVFGPAQLSMQMSKRRTTSALPRVRPWMGQLTLPMPMPASTSPLLYPGLLLLLSRTHERLTRFDRSRDHFLCLHFRCCCRILPPVPEEEQTSRAYFHWEPRRSLEQGWLESSCESNANIAQDSLPQSCSETESQNELWSGLHKWDNWRKVNGRKYWFWCYNNSLFLLQILNRVTY